MPLFEKEAACRNLNEHRYFGIPVAELVEVCPVSLSMPIEM